MSRFRRRLAWAALTVLVPAAVFGAVPRAALGAPAQPEEATPVMVVLDASGSMNEADAPGPRIEAAKKAVRDLVAALPNGAPVGLMAFGTGTGSSAAEKAAGCRDIRRLVAVGPLDRPAFARAAGGLRASGYTPIGESLRAAARELPAEGPRSIVLVSDGEDTCAPPQPCQVAEELKASGVDLVVHTIGFKVNSAARAQLACIASATGGTYREATSGASLGTVLTSRVQRAVRPYAAVGVPIRGGDAPGSAPAIQPGQYLDTYARGGAGAGDAGTVKYYAVLLKPGDTPHFSATIVPPPLPAENVTGLAISMLIVDAAGVDCGPSSGFGFDITVFRKITPQTAVLDPPPVGGRFWRESCSAGDRPLYLKVTRTGDAFRTQQLPVELAFRLEPAVSDPGPPAVTEKSKDLPAPSPGPAQLVEAGTSFNDAPALAPGSYRDSITTGETRYFRVRLDWGQRLAYRITLPTQGVPIQSAALYVLVASPLRAGAEQTASGTTYVLVGGREDQEVFGSTAVPVRYLNRESTRLFDVRPYSVDGYYYLVLDLSWPLTSKEPLSFPFTLTVVTSGGEPGPRYVTDAGGYGRTTTTSSPPPAHSTEPVRSGTAAAEPGRLVGWVLAAAAGAGVVLAAAVVLLVRRRGSRVT
jgi:Ca-activated chloride channel homolog